MSRSSARRAQVEPLAALVAVAAVGMALALHAGALSAHVPDTSRRDVATPALRDALSRLRVGGVVRPRRRVALPSRTPDGHHLNVTVRTANRTWGVGPRPPAAGETRHASRPVPVRVAPGRVRPGRVRVEVWS